MPLPKILGHFLKTAPTLTVNSPVNDRTLDFVARTPTLELADKVEEGFIRQFTDENFSRIATLLALKSYREGGCPIGGVLRVRESGLILGKGHNRLVQDNNTTWHGETDTTHDASLSSVELYGERPDYSQLIRTTSLSPCGHMCTPTAIKLGDSKILIGDSTNVDNTSNEDYLRDHGVEVLLVEDPKGIELYRRFQQANRALDLEDWKGVAAVREAGLTPQRRNVYTPVHDIFPEIVPLGQ